jgi:hypothetical protein
MVKDMIFKFFSPLKMTNYVVLLNDHPVYYFKMPFKFNEARLQQVCLTEIKLKDPLWANVWLNDECIYSFPILENTDLSKFTVEVKLSV